MKHPINRKSWQRMTLSMLGLVIIVLTWMQAVAHLYDLPPAALASFTTITVNAQYVIGAIVIFMVTGRLVYEWTNSTASSIVEQGTQLLHEERTPAPKHFDDPSIP